jgi:hypothetical protein
MKKPTLIPFLLSTLLMLGLTGLRAPNGVTRPDQSRSYLDLGERLIALAETPDDHRLARQVLAMGLVVSIEQGDTALAGSCAIAMVSSHPDDIETQQQLWDLALTIDPRRLSQWMQFRPDTTDVMMMKQAAECLRLARNEDPDQASRLFQRPVIKNSVLRTGAGLGYSENEIQSALRPLLAERSRDPCRGNYFRTVIENGESVRRVCDFHRSPLGTTRDTQTLVMLLRIESACLESAQSMDDWGAVSTLGTTRPARSPDVEWLIATTGIDKSRPYLRDGRWFSGP